MFDPSANRLQGQTLGVSPFTYQAIYSSCLNVSVSTMQIPIKWPKSRDEVWQANIPHTHLAHEKSDQNWMVVKGDKIEFPGGGTHFHYGADKYIASIANVNSLLSYCLIN